MQRQWRSDSTDAPRRHPRTEKYQANQLRIETGDRGTHRSAGAAFGSVGAELVDVSDGGLGLRLLAALAIDSMVSVTAELHSPDSCMELRGEARVVHCLCSDGETYRAGLSFNEVERRYLGCTHGPELPPLEPD